MSDPKPNVSKMPEKKETPEKKDRIPLGTRRLVGYGYLVIFIFFAVFFLFLAEARKVNPGLDTPRWALLLAGILVLPLFLPAFKYVAPYIKSVKISELEVSFAQVEIAAYPLTALADQLRTAAAQVSAPEYETIIISLSSVIIDAIKAVQTTKDEILVVDLREGNVWIPPNLYLLTSLAADRTSVRQIAFVETHHEEEVFVGMCFPDDLREALAQKFPVLQEAAEKSNYQQLALDYPLGHTYFQVLKNLHPPIPPGVPRQEIWLTSSSLFALAGTYIHRQKIESKESLTEDDYRKILRSDYPYTAVVNDEKLESLINRDTVALLVARNQVAKSSA